MLSQRNYTFKISRLPKGNFKSFNVTKWLHLVKDLDRMDTIYNDHEFPYSSESQHIEQGNKYRSEFTVKTFNSNYRYFYDLFSYNYIDYCNYTTGIYLRK